MAEEAKKAVNPAALGLIAFGMTTVMLSLINAGALPQGGMPVVVIMALVFGGTTQWVAGIFEGRNGNTFAMAAFMSYGAFWVWFALLEILGGSHVIDMSLAGSVLNWSLVAWGVFTLYMWIPTFRINVALFIVFLTLWITYFLLGFGGVAGAHVAIVIGGWVGVVCGLTAVYTAFASVTNATVGKDVLPV
ncbi:MAG TPA: acetate uptake transporter [Nevskiaceae bacterium]